MDFEGLVGRRHVTWGVSAMESKFYLLTNTTVINSPDHTPSSTSRGTPWRICFFDNLFTLENRSYVNSSCTSTDDLKQWYLIWKVRTLKRFRTLRFASWGRSFPKAFPEWVSSSSSSRAENPPKRLVHRIYGTGIYIIIIYIYTYIPTKVNISCR